MRIKKVKLINFKRFDNITIDLGENPKKIIALTGPNGCGKSSIFDAFEEKQKEYKGANGNESSWFYSKIWHAIDEKLRSQTYDRNLSIRIFKADNSERFDKKSFNIRTAYRFTSKLSVNSITSKDSILDNHNRPYSSIVIDQQLQDNYERLLGKLINEFFNGSKTGQQTRDEILGKINLILSNILEIKISDLGDVTSGKGQLYFEKGNSKNFPFENLSSGEKEVVDIIIDLIVKVDEYNDTVYCIDEPELHLNTSIQKKLLIEIEKLIPDSCQLWVATHSIGFLRALQTDLKDKAQVLDFSECDYFSDEKTIYPIRGTRRNWQRIFKTALEDLTGLISPERIVYCEGKPTKSDSGEEQGFDSKVYNHIFEESHPNTLFISAGGGTQHANNSSIALQVLSKAFQGVELLRLKDKDQRTPEERLEYLAYAQENRMLTRRDIENYIFDIEIIRNYCSKNHISLNENAYNQLIVNIVEQDIKQGANILPKIKQLCGSHKNLNEFKLELAEYLTEDTVVFTELEKCIFTSE